VGRRQWRTWVGHRVASRQRRMDRRNVVGAFNRRFARFHAESVTLNSRGIAPGTQHKNKFTLQGSHLIPEIRSLYSIPTIGW